MFQVRKSSVEANRVDNLFYNLQITLLILVVSCLIAKNSAAQDATRLSIISDAAGMFNERGYLKSNSFSLDGSESINDFNGNLIYTQRLKYIPVSQNGLHFDLKVTYNGSVGHTINTTFGGGCSYGSTSNFNSPEWILSINDIAIQTLNFEEELLAATWTTSAYAVAKDSTVNLLIPGYHTCYTFNNAEGTQFHAVVNILMGDGSVSQFLSMSDDFPTKHYPYNAYVVTGEYRSFNKEDRSRGYIDNTGDFTLFKEDGTKIRFQYYTPNWKHKFGGNWRPELPDTVRIYLPVEFTDQMGHSINVTYANEPHCSNDEIYGRPLVLSANGLTFDWNEGELLIHDDCLVKYKIGFEDFAGQAMSTCGGSHRGYVSYIQDAENRTTHFDYRSYKRYGADITHTAPCQYVVILNGDTLEPYPYTPQHFILKPSRLWRIRWPEGGKTYYSYYQDILTRWGTDTTVLSSTDSLAIDFHSVCTGNSSVYPCTRTDLFDSLGRDPYFANIVVAKTKVTQQNQIVSRDSLIFSWKNNGSDWSNLSVNDSFFTTRLTDSVTPSLTSYGKKHYSIYRQFPEKGNYSRETRDRGWVIKEIVRKELQREDGQDIELLKDINYWNIADTCDTGDPWCVGTFLLDSSRSYKDGVLTRKVYSRTFDGSPSTDYVCNLQSLTETDSWGVQAVTHYEQAYLGTITSPTQFYSNTIIDAEKRIKGATLLDSVRYGLYVDTSSRGYKGQIREKVTMLIDSGVIRDSIKEKYEYIKNGWPTAEIRSLDNGALYRKISPRGDTVTFSYHEEVPLPNWHLKQTAETSLVNPLFYHQLRQSGEIFTTDAAQFAQNGPFWYKMSIGMSNQERIEYDTLYAVPIIDTVTVTREQNTQGTESHTETMSLNQSVFYKMQLPASNCDAAIGWDTYVRIKRNNQTIKMIECDSPSRIDSGYFSVSAGDLVKFEIEHGSTHGGLHQIQCRFSRLIIHDTVIVADTSPVSLTTYRNINSDGFLTHLVDPNHYISELGYDKIDRFRRAVLPGNFVASDFFEPIFETITATPVLDGESSSGTLGNCTSTSIRLGHQSSLPCLSFASLDVSDLWAEPSNGEVATNIDSAILTMYCYFNEDGATLRAFNLGGTAVPACGAAVSLPTTVSSPTIPLFFNTGSKRLNVTNQVIRWVIDSSWFLPTPPSIPTHAIWLGTSGGGSSDVLHFYSTEYSDVTKQPKLEIFYRIENAADSVYTMLSKYDDITSPGDTSTTKINMIKRVTDTTFKPTTRVAVDGFARVLEKQSIDSVNDINIVKAKADFWDRLAQSTDELDNTDSNKYDNLDRIKETVFPDADDSKIRVEYSDSLANQVGLTSHFSFPDSAKGLFVTKTYDEDNRLTYSYADVLGRERLRRQILSAGDTISTFFDYDDLGNLKTVIKPKGDSVHYRYNSIGWLLREWSADYDSILYKYDKNGNVVLRRDGNLRALGGGSVKYWEYFKYDALNRQTEAGWLEVTGTDTTSRTRIERQFYDQDSSAHSKGRLSLAFRQYGAFAYGEKYDYDQRGRLIKQTNYFEAVLDSAMLNGIYQYSFSGVPYAIQYTYNWSDQITSITYPNNEVVTYVYDDRGRIKHVGNLPDPNRFASLTYTDRNELKEMKYYSDTSTLSQTVDFTYNARGWLEAINGGVATGGDKYGQQIYYTSDLVTTSPAGPSFHNGNIVGQVVAFTDTSLQYRYHYDKLDRLTKVQKRSGASSFQDKQLFSYDKNGNRATYKTSENQIYPLDYNYQTGTNLLASTSGTGHPTGNYSSDVNGNMRTDSTKKATFHYDMQNHLYQAEIRNATAGLSSNVVSYHYNANSDRVYKSFKIYWKEYCGGGGEEGLMGPGGEGLDSSMFESLILVDSGLGEGEMELEGGGGGDWCYYNMTSETRYIVSMGKILAEYSPSSGTPRYQYIYAGEQRIGMRNGTGKLHYYLNDHLGSARVVIDSAGNVKDKFRYLAFGAADAGTTTSTGQPQRYTGKTWDDDGGVNLYYYGARYYEPTLGRFTQIDPLRTKYPSWNPFMYTMDNPLKFIDPDGMAGVRPEDNAKQQQQAQTKDLANTLGVSTTTAKTVQTGAKANQAVANAQVQTVQAVSQAGEAIVAAAPAVEVGAGAGGLAVAIAGVVTGDPVVAAIGLGMEITSLVANGVQTAANPTTANIANTTAQGILTLAGAGGANALTKMADEAGGALTKAQSQALRIGAQGAGAVLGVAASRTIKENTTNSSNNPVP